MISQLELTSRSFYWYNFYFSPEELANHTDLSKAEVFSLGALVLNMMNPLDFTRIIYSYTEYRINKVVVNEKLLNAGRCYSQELMGLVALCLIEDVSRRIDLERLAQELKSNERLIKKKNFVMHIKPLVRNSPKRVKRSGSHDNSEEEWKKED